MLGVVLIAYALMLLPDPIIRLIDNSGAAIVSPVTGTILPSVAADTVLSAVLEIAQRGFLQER